MQNSEFGIQRDESGAGREGATRICILLTQNTVVGCKATEKFGNRKRGWGERVLRGFSNSEQR